MDYSAEQIDLPYLGESLETMLRCEQCGYRHTDFVLLETKDPTRVRHPIEEPDDMSVRVVRSSSGTVRIPELGIDIEPGVASEAFISNIEGVLVRIEAVLGQLERDSDDPETLQRIRDLQDTLHGTRTGDAPPLTMVIEDPFGNSAIIGNKAIKESIPEEEAAHLKTGTFVFDQSDLQTTDEEEEEE